MMLQLENQRYQARWAAEIIFLFFEVQHNLLTCYSNLEEILALIASFQIEVHNLQSLI